MILSAAANDQQDACNCRIGDEDGKPPDPVPELPTIIFLLTGIATILLITHRH